MSNEQRNPEQPTAEEVIYALDAGLCVNCQDDALMPRQVERAVNELILAAKAIRATVKILKLPPHPDEIDRLIHALHGKRINHVK